MGRPPIVGRIHLIALVSLIWALPSPLGPAHLIPPTSHTAQAPPNAVGVLFEVLSKCGARLHERDRWRIAGVIDQESRRYGYDPLFVVAMVEVESTCVPTARSPYGAVGLVQLKPSVAHALAEEAKLRRWRAEMLTTPSFNVHLGLRYLSQLEKRFGDSHLALAAFNLGPTRVAKMPRHHARNARYVRKILSRYESLRARYG